MTFRHAVLPLGAVLVLGLGVYLFVEVRAQPAPPPIVAENRTQPARSPPAEARAQPVAPPNASAVAPRPVAPARPPTDPAPAPREGASAAPDAGPLAGPRLDAAMDEANTAYDRGDFEDAKQLAGRVLAQQPTSVRMLRIMVSASCIDGDSAVAQAHYARLPARDQEQMRVRCARYGVAFADK